MGSGYSTGQSSTNEKEIKNKQVYIRKVSFKRFTGTGEYV